MTAHATEIQVLEPGDILHVGDIDPAKRALLMFLANRTAATRHAYEIDLKQFWQWCLDYGLAPLTVDKVHVQLYLEHLQTRGYADATVARRFGTARLFLKMCYDEEIIERDPTRRIPAPRVDRDKQRRTWFTTVDVALVLRFAQPRPLDYALLFFMEVTAMRVGEVLALDVDDIHRDPGRAWVGFTGKGSKYAEIDLDYATVSALDRYIGDRTTGPLFLNRAGNRMRRPQVQDTIDRARRQAGIAYRVTPHGLRRTHARTAAEQGEDIFSISEDLRHADPKTTKIYIGKDSGRGKVTRQKVSSLMVQMTRQGG